MEKEESGWWKVTQPGMSEEYDIRFSIRAFAQGSSESEMRRMLALSSLAYVLNARSGLALSYPGFRGTVPDDGVPKWNGVPVTEAILNLFSDYEAR